MKALVESKKALITKTLLVPGFCPKEITLHNFNGWVKIRNIKAGMLEFSSAGIVAAFNGGGDEPLNSLSYKDAFYLSRAIVNSGGVVLNGGRNTGIMRATAEAAGKMCLGINFDAQIKAGKAHAYGKRLVVHPLTRLALLTVCAPIVIIYSGGLGTFHELINALVAVKNRSLYKLDAPRLFCSIFWRKTLLTASKSGIIPRSYLTEIKFFSNGKTILKQLLT